MTELIIACVAAVTIGAVILSGRYADSEETLQQVCRWQRCGHVDGALLNCEPEETGTAELLSEAVKATESGAIRWECGP